MKKKENSQEEVEKIQKGQKQINKNSRGITLIALVITIIVLIILAGISMNLVLGNNGLFTKAQEAAKNYQTAQNMEVAEIEELEKIIPSKAIIELKELKVGDYIEYYSGANGKITCRVLYPMDSEYGLQIISDQIVSKLTLKTDTWEIARDTYNNLLEILNGKTEEYINTNYVTDARCVGSIPTVENGKFVDKNKSKDESGSYIDETKTYLLPDNYATQEVLDGSNDTKCVLADENYKIDEQQLKDNDLYIIKDDYYIGSRQMFTEWRTFVGTCFACRHINIQNSIVTSDWLCRIKDDGQVDLRDPSLEFGIRSCFLLDTNKAKVIDGTGKLEDPYILGM